jgi:tetratricopeptide (TPR) repeat protein
MSKLIKSLVQGVSMREMVSLLGKIQGRIITLPKGFEKRSGEALMAEQATFAYIFVHRFLPVLRIFILVALVGVSLAYLIHRFIWVPIAADLIYQNGYKLIATGDYEKANERFVEAVNLHKKKNWFYRYAEAFRDKRQYVDAETIYDSLLWYYPRDKKGVLDYAAMETNYLSNYAKADSLLRRNILDFRLDDKEALVAVGDNALLWGDVDPERYEDARQVYARLLERYGWLDPYVERMLKYFIRTDNLKEVLPLQAYFMSSQERKISAVTLGELGGYLVDRKFEEVKGVPSEYISQIQGIRDILIRAVRADASLPEPHYHLARYYNYFGNVQEERVTLERAIQAFEAVKQESVPRLNARIDAHRRYSQLLTNNREFFAAEEQLIKAIGLYENGVSRWLIPRAPQFGRLYADLGDIEYFTKDGNMNMALEYYLRAEENGWAPPEIQYRIGSAYYHQRQWASALVRFVTASAEMPLNRRLLNALGNASYMRGNYSIAQGYYSRLLDILDTDRQRFDILTPNDRADHLELAERLVVARNNFGVTLEALTENTGNPQYRSEALGLYTESVRAWDSLTRNAETLIRASAADISTPGKNLAFLNAQNVFFPSSVYERQIYIQIDKDVLEPSPWETLSPQSVLLSDALF